MRTKERVRELGEVFTPPHIVRKMLDLIDDQTAITEPAAKCIDPACGDGRFLKELLRRKLEALPELPAEPHCFQALLCLASVYGIDIDRLNVEEARDQQVEAFFQFQQVPRGSGLFEAACAIVQGVIVLGDFLNPSGMHLTDYEPVDGFRFRRVLWPAEVALKPKHERDLMDGPAAVLPAVHWSELRN